MLKKAIINISIAIFAVLIAVTPIEIYLRLSPPPQSPVSFPERPKFYYIPSNAANMRGNLFSSPKPAGEFRIAVIGDSFTFAPKMQYDDAFPARLGRMFNLNLSERPVNVISYGTSGASTLDEIRLTKLALRNQADFILLEITLNDPQLFSPHKTPADFACANAKDCPQPGFLARHSKLLQWVRQRLFNRASVQKYIDYHRDLFENPVSWKRFSESLAKIKGLADKSQVPMAVVVFPLFDFPIDQEYPFRGIHQKILDYAAELSIPALDLSKAFEGLETGRLVLIPGKDSHPNEIAHRIAAEAIYKWLIKSKILPRDFKIKKVFDMRETAKWFRHRK